MRKLLAILAATAITTVAGTAMAAPITTTTTLTVKASVVPVCKASATTHIDFGNLDPINDVATNTLASTKTSAGEILVQCTQGTSYTITAPATATIAMGTDTITYTPVMPTVPANDGTVVGKSYTIDASVAKTAYSSVPAGAYTGNLTVTVTY